MILAQQPDTLQLLYITQDANFFKNSRFYIKNLITNNTNRYFIQEKTNEKYDIKYIFFKYVFTFEIYLHFASILRKKIPFVLKNHFIPSLKKVLRSKASMIVENYYTL